MNNNVPFLNRRHFLHATAAMGVGAGLLPSPLSAETAGHKPEKTEKPDYNQRYRPQY